MPTWSHFTSYLDGTRPITKAERDELLDNFTEAVRLFVRVDATKLAALKSSLLVSDRVASTAPSAVTDHLSGVIGALSSTFCPSGLDVLAAAATAEGLTSTEYNALFDASANRTRKTALDHHRVWNVLKRTVDGLAECQPQFHATFDKAPAMRTKHGHEEFTSPSTPAKRFLKKLTTWRSYYQGGAEGFVFGSFWELSTIDPATGAETITTSDPAPPPGTAFGGARVDWETPLSISTSRTMRRTVWESTDGTPGQFTHIESIETLEAEHTTALLIDDTIADLAAWGTFPPDPAVDADYIVLFPVCYAGGVVVRLPGYGVVVNQWVLAADELTFAVQRARYRIEYPALLAGTYTIEWDEVFIPDGATGPDDWVVLANCGASGVTEADAHSDVLDLTETRANGEVYVTNVRVTSFAP